MDMAPSRTLQVVLPSRREANFQDFGFQLLHRFFINFRINFWMDFGWFWVPFWAPFWTADGNFWASFFITKLPSHFDQKSSKMEGGFLRDFFTILPPFLDDFCSFGASGAWEPQKLKKIQKITENWSKIDRKLFQKWSENWSSFVQNSSKRCAGVLPKAAQYI